MVLGPEVDVHIVHHMAIGEVAIVGSAPIPPVPVGVAIGRTDAGGEVGHEDPRADPQVIGDVDPAPALLSEGDDDLGTHPGLPGHQVDHRKLFRVEPGGRVVGHPGHGNPVHVTHGEVDGSQSIPIDHHPCLDLGLGGGRQEADKEQAPQCARPESPDSSGSDSAPPCTHLPPPWNRPGLLPLTRQKDRWPPRSKVQNCKRGAVALRKT
jgi:hypothetical protein